MAKLNFTTPIGVARFPKITEPDTQGKYADNKYKTDVIFDANDLTAIKDQVQEFAKQHFDKDDLKSLDWPYKVKKDKESGDSVEVVVFKSKNKPLIIDSKRNKVPEGVKIGGGSRIRIGGTMNTYKEPKKGVNIYLNAVQVIELQRNFSADDFDVEEGDDAFVVDTPVADDAQSGEDLDF